MTPGLFIGATTGYAGKNTMLMGIGLRLIREGLNLGYMKPVGFASVNKDGRSVDEDACFVQEVLGLDDDPELVTPVLLDQDLKMQAFQSGLPDLMPKVKQAYEQLSNGRDAMLLGGSGGLLSGRFCDMSGLRLVRELGLKTIIVDRLQNYIKYDTLAAYKDALGDRMVGVILNDVPSGYMSEVEGLIKPFLERIGAPVIGIVPRDMLMGAISVLELAERLSARIVSAQEKCHRMVEKFLIGSMQVENFMTYMRRQKNAAVIVGGDRADVQLVALEASCPCLILTGNLYPNDIILSRADSLGIPVLLVREDTYSAAQKMESVLSRHKLRDSIKVRQGVQLVGGALDFAAVRKALERP